MINKRFKPDFSFERDAGADFGIPVCGTDEAGRGPLAGPVVAAAVVLPPKLVAEGLFDKLNDSKVMPLKARIEAFDLIVETCDFCIAEASIEEIDDINILNASMLAMKRAVEGLKTPVQLALIDGNRAPKLDCQTQTIVKGDSRSLSIAAASVLAKQHRDAIMLKLHHQEPHYGWNKNKGYPTKLHREALQIHGISKFHRRSFAPIKYICEQVEKLTP